MIETKYEDIKYVLTNSKYKFYVRDGEDLVIHLTRNMYLSVERFIILGRPLQIIIRIQVIDPCFMMDKNCKEEDPKTLLTQEFDINGPSEIEIPVNK